jgi:hypothetical protein
MKKAPREEMLTVIRDILRGQIYVSRDLAMRAFQKSLETMPRTRALGSVPVVDNLSDREMHVFQLIGSGLGTKKIAHSLPEFQRSDFEVLPSPRRGRRIHTRLRRDYSLASESNTNSIRRIPLSHR